MFSIDQALAHWQKEGLLTAAKAKELKTALPAGAQHDQTARAISIFSAVGAILIGLGAILFVGSNWQELSSMTKLSILLAATLGTGLAGNVLKEGKTYVKTGMALLFVNVLIFGASIFLVGQIFNLPLNFSLGAFLWFIVTAYFAYTLSSRLHLWVSVPLLLLTIGWFWSSQGVGSEFDFLTDNRHSLFSLLSIIGCILLNLSPLHARVKSLNFASPTLLHWGIFLILFQQVVATADRSVFYGYFTPPFDHFVTILFAVLFLSIAAALIWGKFSSGQGRTGLTAMFLFLAFSSGLSLLPHLFGVDAFAYSSTALQTGFFSTFFVLYIVLVFLACFLVIWYGTLLRSTTFVNLGMVALAFCIIIQYFSWAFLQLNRSIAFILGGLLILIVSALLERQRRTIVSSFHLSA